MLTALEIENFKGIANRQRIEFAPLTLLFGANSAGKSSILQALLYLHEIVERGAADVDRTELGAETFGLGGFARLVYGHDLTKAVKIKVEFTTPDVMEPLFAPAAQKLFDGLDDWIRGAWVEVAASFRNATAFSGPVVDEVVIGVNGDPRPLVRLKAGLTLRDGEPLWASLDAEHPLLHQAAFERRPAVDWDGDQPILPEDEAEATEALEQEWRGFLETCSRLAIAPETTGVFGSPGQAENPLPAGVHIFALRCNRLGAFPHPGEALEMIAEEGETTRSALLRALGTTRAEELVDLFHGSMEDAHRFARDLKAFIQRRSERGTIEGLLATIVSGPLRRLQAILREIVYLGPLRSVPTRGLLLGSAGARATWATGLAAWEALLADRLNLVEDTNGWLDRLQAGCTVKIQPLVDPAASAEETATEHVDKVLRRLMLEVKDGTYVLPAEVGSGIAQVMPVIVACLRNRPGLITIEQPELHVHPALQVGLGDLMIEAVTGRNGRSRILAETHSEHLILRVKRRIRETTDGELAEGVRPFAADELNVVYVESTTDGVRFRRLRIDEQGEFLDPWPRGFFAERMRELL